MLILIYIILKCYGESCFKVNVLKIKLKFWQPRHKSGSNGSWIPKCNSKGIFGRNDKNRTCLNAKFKTNNSEKVLGKFGHLIRVLS